MPPAKSAKPEKKKEIILFRPPISSSSLLYVPSNAIEGKSRPNMHEQTLNLNVFHLLSKVWGTTQ